MTVTKFGFRNVDVQSETRSSSASCRAQGWAVLRTNTGGTLRQEDVAPDAIMLIEFSSKLRHWMSPEDASSEEIIAYIQSMQTAPTCYMHFSTADVPIRELEEKRFSARLRSEMAPPHKRVMSIFAEAALSRLTRDFSPGSSVSSLEAEDG